MPRPDRLAVVATHLRPSQGFGGVAESTSELIRAWRGQGRDVEVVVSDGTLGPPLTRAAVEQALGAPARTYRAMWAVRWGFGPAAPITIARAILASDRVYISGVATWPTTWAALIARWAGRPYVVATRGAVMAEHWSAIRKTKPLKALFYRAFVLPALRGASCVHACSRLEADDAIAAEPRARVFVAPNAFDIRPSAADGVAPAPAAGLRLLYLGRLSPEKGILGFARRFAAARRPGDQLSIAGAPDGAYGGEVVRLCETTEGFAHLGVLARDRVPDAIRGVDALVLPSGVDGDVRENFGNVVVEALAHGRPVLVTRGLAWDGIERAGVGALFDRSMRDLEPAMDRLRAWSGDDAVWPRAVCYARRHFAAEAVAETVWRAIFPPAEPEPADAR